MTARSTEIAAVPPGPLTDWLREAVPQVPAGDGPVAVERISGGHSNLTYRITDAAGGQWALRRPPTGMVLATAHDMGREWRFISALAGTPVPVPPPVAFCTDPDVTGAQFYVMGGRRPRAARVAADPGGGGAGRAGGVAAGTGCPGAGDVGHDGPPIRVRTGHLAGPYGGSFEGE